MRATIDSGRAAAARRTRSHAAITSTDPTRPRTATRPNAVVLIVAIPGMTPASQTAVSAASKTKKIATSPRPIRLVDTDADGGNRDHAHGTAAASDELERSGNDHSPGRRQLVELAEAGQTELSGAVHHRVVRKRGVERASLTGVGADRFDADAEHVPVLRQHARRVGVEARAVRAVGSGVDERRPIRSAAPPRSQEHPRAAGHATVRALPGLEVRDRQ